MAYADGRVEEAALLREAADPVDDRLDELEHENRMLKKEIEGLEYELVEARA